MLKQLEFSFSYDLNIQGTNDEVYNNHCLLLEHFRKPFWLVDKRWFVTSEFVMMKGKSTIKIYTGSPSIPYRHFDSVVCMLSSVDDIYKLIVYPADAKNDQNTSEEVCELYKEKSESKIFNKFLAFSHYPETELILKFF